MRFGLVVTSVLLLASCSTDDVDRPTPSSEQRADVARFCRSAGQILVDPTNIRSRITSLDTAGLLDEQRVRYESAVAKYQAAMLTGTWSDAAIVSMINDTCGTTYQIVTSIA